MRQKTEKARVGQQCWPKGLSMRPKVILKKWLNMRPRVILKKWLNMRPKVILKKWLNMRTTSFNYDDRENDSLVHHDDSVVQHDDKQDIRGYEIDEEKREYEDGPKLPRRNSETLRGQYIKTDEIRIHIGTWNIGGILPPDELNMEDWLNTEEPADIYVISMQEIVPLNAGNVFGAEDRQRVPNWEYLIRKTLNRLQPAKLKYKYYSDPPSPSKSELLEDAAVDELVFEGDTATDDETKHLLSWGDNNEHSEADITEKDLTSHSCRDAELSIGKEQKEQKQVPLKRLERLHHTSLVDYHVDSEVTFTQEKKLLKTLTKSEGLGLVWPEQPLDLINKNQLEVPNIVRSKTCFRMFNSFKQAPNDVKKSSKSGLVPKPDLSIRRSRSKKSTYVRIISKQMVGLYLSIWVRRSLRRHIQNLKVSVVGVGAMGYIGNKGSVAVSMSIYQTFFCFVCSHLFAGEKCGDELRRNADVQETHQKTQFRPVGSTRLPKTIYEHDRVFWLGDLNYRIDLPYEKIHELISKNEWHSLAEKDQLKHELWKGHSFYGWSEGVLTFPPTYKYEFKTTKYIGDDKKGGRRRPAWCDRILSYGKGIRLLEYGTAEIDLSDHRPVSGSFIVEIEKICHRKLQKALSLTNAEIQGE